MQNHEGLKQGSQEWLAYRIEHDNASEIAAVLGLSKTTTRTELLHMKHTGLGKEFSDWVQRNVLDYGHEVEAKVRPLVEAMIGEDLYTVTCSEGRLSASLDGLTMSEEIVFECKQWNAEIAAQVADGIMPEQHMPQCQQILLVTGAQKLIFAVGDGTPENLLTLEVFPDPVWFERITAGWAQFHIDLAAYVPTEKPVAAVGAAVTALPAVSVQVTGSIAIKDNFQAFEVALKDFIENRLIRLPKTDQDFADLDKQIKALKGAESALNALEVQMLSQVAPVDTAKRTKDMLYAMARDNRLMAEKMLAVRKEQIKVEQVQRGRTALAEHIDALNVRLGHRYMPATNADFAAAIKGLRTVESLENAVDTLLANEKIKADAVADKIQANLTTLREFGKDHVFLFADTGSIVLKAPEDLTMLVKSRIAEHQAAEEKRLTAQREQIRAEEQAKAEKEAREKVAREAEVARLAAAAIEAKAAADALAALPVVAITKMVAVLDDADSAPVILVERAPAVNVVPMAPRQTTAAPAPATPPTLKLGQIGERLGFSLTGDFLKNIGFEPAARDKSALLFHEHDFPLICMRLVAHIQQVQAKQAA